MKGYARILILALLVLGCGKSNLIDEAIKNIADGSYAIFDFFGEGDSVKGVASDFGLKAALPNGTRLEWTFPEDLKGLLTIDGNNVEVERPKGLNETFTFTYVIVAPDGSRSSSFPVEVTILGTEVLVSNIEVIPSFTVVKGQKRNFPKVTVVPSYASNQNLKWELVGNASLSFRIIENTIIPTGDVGAEGEVIVSTTDGSNISKKVKVIIVETATNPEKLKVLPGVDHVEVESTKKIYGWVYPSDYNSGVTSFKITQGSDLATIDSTTGEMTIGNKTGTVTVEFSIVADGVTIAPVTSTIHIVDKITAQPTTNVDVAKNITLLDLDRAFNHQKIVDRVPTSYRGHTSTVMTTSGDIVMALPNNHGAGQILLYKTSNEGESWEEVTTKPSSWANSQECPTLYPLDCKDGKRRYVLTSGLPGGDGFNWSFSTDGTTWSEFKQHKTGHKTTVALADFIQIWDPVKGEFEEKWMGVYHSDPGQNWLVELTFEGGYEKENVRWSTPRRMFTKTDATNIEGRIGACEVGFIRSPDHTTIAALLRNQAHNNQGAYIAFSEFSEDEGLTWSTPVPMPSVLDGERHQGAYFEDGRLIILFREMILRGASNNDKNWYCGELGAWMGTFLDLQKGGLGQYLICLKRDYTPNTYSGDDGYPTLDLLEDGSMFMTSYGTFDTNGTLEWTKNAFSTTSAEGEPISTSALGLSIDWTKSAAGTASNKYNWSPYIMSFRYQASDFDEFAKSTHRVNNNGSVTPGKVSFDASWRKFPKGPNHASTLPEERCTGNSTCTYHLSHSANLNHTTRN